MLKLKGNFLRMPKNYDKSIHLCVLLLLLFGTIMVASSSVGESNNQPDIVALTIVKQMAFIIVSYLMMTFIARNFVRFLSKEVKIKADRKENEKIKNRYRIAFKWLGFMIAGLLLYTLFFEPINGSRAWIDLKVFTLQPTEFAKSYMIVLLGLVVNDYGNKKCTFIQFMKEPLLFFLFTFFIILLQPDLGTLIVFVGITIFCLFIPSNPNLNKLKKWLLGIIILATILLIFISTDFGISVLQKFELDYKLGRVVYAADPFNDIFAAGYNLVYSLYAIANGGLGGLGLGASEQKYGYLPEAQTDFIFSVIIEELGILGLLIIIVCYCLILYKLLYYALKSKSEGYKIILIGCALYIIIHFILNVGGVSALIPLTGVPLLFISAGGSSLLSIVALLGVCQSVIALTKGQMQRLQEHK